VLVANALVLLAVVWCVVRRRQRAALIAFLRAWLYADGRVRWSSVARDLLDVLTRVVA
jgi:hypothetical protein